MERIAGNMIQNPLNHNGGSFTEDNVNDLIRAIVNIVDNRIERRLGNSDILHLYDAQLIRITDGLNAVAEYNDVEYDVKNATGIAFTDDDRLQYVKMGTVDSINHIVLYKLKPDVVRVDEINGELQKMKKEISMIQKNR